METFFGLLAFCAGNSPVTGEFPSQRPVTRSFDDFFIWTWISGWVNNREAGHLRRHRAHFDVIVMMTWTNGDLSLMGCCCIYLHAVSWGMLKISFLKWVWKLHLWNLPGATHSSIGKGLLFTNLLFICLTGVFPWYLVDDKSILNQIIVWHRRVFLHGTPADLKSLTRSTASFSVNRSL